jgi:hypothetical protein
MLVFATVLVVREGWRPSSAHEARIQIPKKEGRTGVEGGKEDIPIYKEDYIKEPGQKIFSSRPCK